LLARWLSILFSGLAVIAIATEVASRPSPGDAVPFHAAAARAVSDIPMTMGDWEGTDIPVPTSARALLRPNALLSRSYRNRSTGDQATLVIVQCGDTRDMAGHYPPICYPGQGWEKAGEFRDVPMQIAGRSVVAVRYEFERPDFGRTRRVIVYGFFAVPGAGFPSDMQQIRAIASDYVSRPYGAAQIQVVLDGSVEPQEEQGVVQELLRPIAGVLDLLADPRWRRQ
jgi:hypothetical protein